jgi:hypothetical protein
MKTSIFLLLGAALICGFAIFMSCTQDEMPLTAPETMDKPAPAPNAALDAPILTCEDATQATIFLRITAGASGAPAGFTVQWVKHNDYPELDCGATGGHGKNDNLWSSVHDPCAASLSGVPGCSIYDLGPGESVVIEIGNLLDAECGVSLSSCGANELDCGTEYVFRAFAHNDPQGLGRSPFTGNLCCSTLPCYPGEGCTYTQGYWKTHECLWPSPFAPGAADPTDVRGTPEHYVEDPSCPCIEYQEQNCYRWEECLFVPEAGDGIPDNLETFDANGNVISVQCGLNINNNGCSNCNGVCSCDGSNTIPIGSVEYNQCELLCALNEPAMGNALMILAHQLIAAKLNAMNGATSSSCNLDEADGLIGTSNILTGEVDPESPEGQLLIAMAACLDNYNNGGEGIPHCE